MRITLQIENVDRLETGGQVSYSCTDRGFDIGRHEHLDWSLPDPQRIISGKHCEVRFEDGNFVLYDVSTNGTFLNGSPNRLDKSHALRPGDRIMIGDYIISVALEHDNVQPSAAPAALEQAHPTPTWNAPQQPSYPSNASMHPQQAAPVAPAPHPAGSPWDASPSMEGRHAPPSSDPGVGTPADSVWGQEGHGWGSADPGLYNPQPEPVREASRPAQADPLDHLAPQPHLVESAGASPEPHFPAPASSAVPAPANPVPVSTQDPPVAAPEQPLFNMPDLGPSDPSKVRASPMEAADAAPAETEFPFPDTPDWASAPSASSEVEQERSDTVSEDVAVPPGGEQIDGPQSEAHGIERATMSGDAAPIEQSPKPDAGFFKAFAEGAGIPESALQGRDPEEFARELGSVLQEITSDLMGLLQARSQVKAMTRNANRTLISRSGNNALKFSPTAQSALQTMLSPNAEENGYLPMEKAMSAAFKDIQKHHVWTYSAMQKAAARFDETLSPRAIEEEGKVTKSAFANQNAKLWERMQERWTSLSSSYDDGLVGVFTQYFTEGYEELSSQDEGQGVDQF